MEYVRICDSLNDFGKLVPKSELLNHLKTNDSEYYSSIFLYGEEDYEHFKKTGTVKGIKELKTNRLVWDFDDKLNPENAKKDTLDLVTRLIENGVPVDAIEIAFSGNKGFSVDVKTVHRLTRQEFKSITLKLSEGLKTRDSKIHNTNRIFRIPLTKHPVSGLYKIIISLEDLSNSRIEDIKERAKTFETSGDMIETEITLPESILAMATQASEVNKMDYTSMPLKPDMSKKPRNVPACKWAMMQGFIKPGNKHNAIMALGAYWKNLGYPIEITYRMLKGTFERQHKLYPEDEAVAKEHIWERVNFIYSEDWEGGTYSCKDHEFLKEHCPALGSNECHVSDTKTNLVTIGSVADKFYKYATEIDKNTVKTGIKSVDEQIRLQTSSHVIIAGSSGSGKTSLILNILNNLSKKGLKGVFGSMDMGPALIYQKLAHRVSGLNDKELYDLYRNREQDKINKIATEIDNEFKNIKFDFRSGIEIDSLRENLLEAKYKEGDNLKLVVLDFINRIRGPFSEETANLAYIAPRLSDLANESETLIISLAQIARAKGGPSTPLLDSRVAKGSSAIEESATVLFGIWRPGYNKGINDKYLTLSALKTRMGKEFTEALYFNGLTSEVRDLTPDEQKQYEKFVDEQEEEKNGNKSERFDPFGGF